MKVRSSILSLTLLYALAACSSAGPGTSALPSSLATSGTPGVAPQSVKPGTYYHAQYVWVANEPVTAGAPESFSSFDAYSQAIVSPAPSSTQRIPAGHPYVDQGFTRDKFGNFVYSYGWNAPNAIVTCSGSPAGNCVPVSAISGASTGLNDPRGLAIDANGRIAVANLGASSVITFETGSDGDVDPLWTLAGSTTQISQPGAVAFDKAGNLWVAQYGKLLEFAKGASGNVAPMRVIVGNQTGLGATSAIAIDKTGTIYVVDEYTNRLAAFAENGLGSNVSPNRVWNNPAVSKISMPLGVAVDDYNVYVANYGNNSVSIFSTSPYSSNGFLAWIQGGATGLTQPLGIALQ